MTPTEEPTPPWLDRTLVIDNYDSFTWNLVHQLRTLGDDPVVIRSASVDLALVEHHPPARLLISPGPGDPRGASQSLAAIRVLTGRVPILGVCLGHQCLGVAAGATVRRASPVHGKTSAIEHDARGLFRGVPNPVLAGRYHSLALDPASLPDHLEPTAWAPGGSGRILMGMRHRHLPLEGVQFHPDSFLTDHGLKMIGNFLSWAA